ncbi:MAG: D-alanyl-D-alanine carboxypeptidase family protein [Xanthomonadales bacterium]|nr:hypothetical protein [Xanthomonadales bacterium]MCC6594805.1 D-alanyl-D-alanine carboxypeptidase family protein [Xanthomonadales bacterium]
MRLAQMRIPLRGAPLARIRRTLARLDQARRLAVIAALRGDLASVAADWPPDPLAQVWAACIASRNLPLHPEAVLLASVGRDRYGRSHWLQPAAAGALARLRTVAMADGIALEVVSSFRSVHDQRRILARKLTAGQTLADILRVNAPPGCSEHHSGCAVDLAVPGQAPLTEDFAATPACAWLRRHADRFGFHMSYPPDNPWGFMHEPWHWCFRDRSVRMPVARPE